MREVKETGRRNRLCWQRRNHYNDDMEAGATNTVSVTVLRAKPGEYLARVKRGEPLIVTERGKPVARLEPIPPSRLAEMTPQIVKDAT